VFLRYLKMISWECQLPDCAIDLPRNEPWGRGGGFLCESVTNGDTGCLEADDVVRGGDGAGIGSSAVTAVPGGRL